MSRHLLTVLVPLAGLALTGCPEGEDTQDTQDTQVVDEGDPVVVVMGAPYMQTGASADLSVMIYNTDATAVTWASDAEAVLTVDETGKATAHSPGQANVTATVDVDGTAVVGELGIFVQNEIPFYDEWRASGHAKYDAEAFNHWNEDGEIQTSCARCHSTPGFQDYIGADGTAADVVDNPAPLGTGVECAACHNSVTPTLDHVIFPSGEIVEDLGPEARCMTCHQGRASGDTLDAKFVELGLTETPDAVDAGIRFTNIHYYPAGATLFAGQVRGGYQYPGQVYDWRFRHVGEANVCIECHDQHSLEIRIDTCAECHEGVTTVEDLKDVRMMASLAGDYDGDGDTEEGIYHEIDGLRGQVLASLQQYVKDQGLGAICYGSNYPYFLQDTNDNGVCDTDETEGYASWSPRSASAAYNYQMSVKDPGNFAHNAKYTIQLLHDSLQDLNQGLTSPADLSGLVRNDPGHFNGAGEPARHWDEDEAISSSCSQCHGGQLGLEFYLEYGVGLSGEEPDNGLECETCHTGLPDFSVIRTVDEVTFPSDITIEDEGNTSNLCMTCHQGRESKATVDERIASGRLGFRNIHYLPAGAVKYGALAEVGYQYDEKSYAGPWTDHPGGNNCIDCHDPVATEHTFEVDHAFADTCATCHRSATEPHDIRSSSKHGADYDGDGSASEPLAGEIEGLSAKLMTAMQAGADICYDAHSYPYFFTDTNKDGVCQETEAVRANAFSSWTIPLMKSTFNYQMAQKDPGAWAHNFDYMGQLLYDSIEDVGGSTSGLVRP